MWVKEKKTFSWQKATSSTLLWRHKITNKKIYSFHFLLTLNECFFFISLKEKTSSLRKINFRSLFRLHTQHKKWKFLHLQLYIFFMPKILFNSFSLCFCVHCWTPSIKKSIKNFVFKINSRFCGNVFFLVYRKDWKKKTTKSTSKETFRPIP